MTLCVVWDVDCFPCSRRVIPLWLMETKLKLCQELKVFAALQDYGEFHFIEMDLFETSIKQIL